MDNFSVAQDEMAKLSLGQYPEKPRAAIHTQGVVTTDITRRFSAAVKTLQPGELVKDGFFTLFESVSALEIMDPKMDSGCAVPGENIEEEYDVSQKLLPEQVLGIIDELICHEISWHLGYPLSQTLLTSVYVEALSMPDPATVDEAHFVRHEDSETRSEPMLQILRAYCLGMLKGCSYVNERIKLEQYYEEEDFVSNTYNRTLLRRLSTSSIQSAISEALETLKLLEGKVSDEILEALSARLTLRRIFLQAADLPENMKDSNEALAPWVEAADVLPVIERTHDLVKDVDDAFSAKLQSKLASTMPPRPIVKLDFKAAFAHLSRLFEDGREVVSVLNYTDSQCLLTFVSTFQAKRPQPLVYVRTLLQTLIFDDMRILGRLSIRQLLDDDLSIITLPASPVLARSNDDIEAVHDTRFVMSQQMELFRQRAAHPFLEFLRALCQNRCRTRRTLCHLVRDWECLQLDAEDIDYVLQIKTEELPLVNRYPTSNSAESNESYTLGLSSWTYLYKLRLMETIVQLGFELEIYQPDEHLHMYWYLNYLAKNRLHHAERIKSFVVGRFEELRRASPALLAQELGDVAFEKQLQRALTYTRLALLDAAVTWELSDALTCLHAVLARLDLVRAPPRPYSSDELRYDLRMKPFAVIGLPSLPTFAETVAGARLPQMSIAATLAYGERALLGAKKGFDALSKLSAEESFSVGSHDRWVAMAKNGLKSCIATNIAITTLRKKMVAGAEEPVNGHSLGLKVEVPTPDECYHPSWIIPKIINMSE